MSVRQGRGCFMPTLCNVSRKVIMLQVLRHLHFSKLLLLLLSLDALFILAHVLRVLLASGDAFWWLSVDTDGSAPEVFQYLKFMFITSGLLVLFTRHKAWTYGVWAGIFTFALLDDALRIHERLGGEAIGWFGLVPAFGLGARDLGEFTVWGAVGVVVFAALLFTYLRAAPGVKRFSRHLFYRFAFLAFFGLGLDLAHSALLHTSVRGVAVTEDGGEMLALSLIVAFVWSQVRGARGAEQPTRPFTKRTQKTTVAAFTVKDNL